MQLQEYCAPSDKSLIDDYLRPKIAGKCVGDCIHDVDVYSDHPYNLVREHDPAVAGGGIWYFFSPTRHVGGKNAHRGRRCSRQRSWTVAGADGRKKGAWNPSKTKYEVESSAGGGGYFRKLTYQETTPSGAIVKPGWMMVEYGITEEHGGGDMVLCKMYKSSRGGLGSSDVPSRCALPSSPARKRKADAIEHPEAPTIARQRKLYETNVDDDDAMSSFAQMLEDELELVSYFEIENLPGGGEPAAPEYRDQPNAAMPQHDPEAAADNDDDVMEIGLNEFLGSSAATLPDEDDGDDMCGLACPPMDDEYVELVLSMPLVQFDPAFIEEFISDP